VYGNTNQFGLRKLCISVSFSFCLIKKRNVDKFHNGTWVAKVLMKLLGEMNMQSDYCAQNSGFARLILQRVLQSIFMVVILLAMSIAGAQDGTNSNGNNNGSNNSGNGNGMLDPIQVKKLAEQVYTKNIAVDFENLAKLQFYAFQETALEFARRIRFEAQYDPSTMNQGRFVFLDQSLSGLIKMMTMVDPAMAVYANIESRHMDPIVEQKHDPIAKELEKAAYDIQTIYGGSGEHFEQLLNKIWMVRQAVLHMDTAFPELSEFIKAMDPNSSEEDRRIKSSIPEVKNSDADTKTNLPALLDAGRYRDFSLDQARDNIKSIKKHLEANLIEQPELVRFLEEVEMRNYLYPRTRPEVFMTMGLPGVGKDTVAESYAIAMHEGNVEAAEDHIYRFKIARKDADLWSELGSSTGYVGSSSFPPFLRWCIEHSGGKYKLVEMKGQKGPEYKVEKNPEWKGKSLPGTVPPERAIVFINEFHDWSYNIKNDFLKQFIEKGIIPINNPNGGISQMRLNFTVQIASNDGIGLLADRHIDGRPRGKRQEFKELLRRWMAIHHRKDRLRAEIVKDHGSGEGEQRKGTSEEVANRIQNIFLLQPLSPEGLRKIANILMERLRSKLENINSNLGKIRLAWTENVLKVIQDYQYVAEENARPMENKVESLVQTTIDKALFKGKFGDHNSEKEISIDILPKNDGTLEFVAEIKAEEEGKEIKSETRLPVEASEATKFNDPLSKEELSELMNLGEKLKNQVFGVDHVIDEIVKAVVRSETEATVNLDRVDARLPKANVFAFFGLSSTGKTEMTKALAEILTGNRENVWLVNANQLKHEGHWEEKFGYDQADPNKLSEFQKEYDRRNGRMIVVLDELANANMEHTKILYDYFREAEVGGRKMAGVTFIVTGNAGEEWYQGIPSRVPETEKHFSMLEIYRKMIKRKNEQENLLKRYFPEALIKRIGMRRIFFFPPLDFKAIRQLFYLKLKIHMEGEFGENRERYWFDVKFANKQEVERIVEIFEREGFALDGQGASIDDFVREGFALDLKYKLKELLAQGKIENGEEVVLKLNSEKTEANRYDRGNDAGVTSKGVYIDVELPQRNDGFTFFIQGHPHQLDVKTTTVDQVLTAYHEAGHEMVRHIFFGDKFMPDGISVIPGVDWFGTRWIYYLGVARSEQIERYEMTREAVVRDMAILQGGWMAQALVTGGEYHDSGKSNDIERATELARLAIVQIGVSDKFGVEALPPGMTPAEYARSLKGERAEIYQSELQSMIEESVKLAKESLLVNYDVFIKMGQELARVGDMKGPAMVEFYEKFGHEIIAEFEQFEEFRDRALEIREGKYTRNSRGDVTYFKDMGLIDRALYYVGLKKPDLALSEESIKAKEGSYRKRDGDLRADSLMPEHVERIEDVVERYKAENRKGVPVPDNIPVSSEAKVLELKAGSSEVNFAEGVDISGGTPSASRVCKSLFM